MVAATASSSPAASEAARAAPSVGRFRWARPAAGLLARIVWHEAQELAAFVADAERAAEPRRVAGCAFASTAGTLASSSSVGSAVGGQKLPRPRTTSVAAPYDKSKLMFAPGPTADAKGVPNVGGFPPGSRHGRFEPGFGDNAPGGQQEVGPGRSPSPRRRSPPPASISPWPSPPVRRADPPFGPAAAPSMSSPPPSLRRAGSARIPPGCPPQRQMRLRRGGVSAGVPRVPSVWPNFWTPDSGPNSGLSNPGLLP